MRKMKAKVHNGGLGLLPRMTPISLLVVLSFGEEMGENGFTPPFFKNFHQLRLPRRANLIFFCKKKIFLQDFVYSLLCIYFFSKIL